VVVQQVLNVHTASHCIVGGHLWKKIHWRNLSYKHAYTSIYMTMRLAILTPCAIML
jgi:hypothetical protein